jgi:hypothetical protein
MKYHSKRIDSEEFQKTNPPWYTGAFKVRLEHNGTKIEKVLPLEVRQVIDAFNFDYEEAQAFKYLIRWKHKYKTTSGKSKDLLKLVTYVSFILDDIGNDIAKLQEEILRLEEDCKKDIQKILNETTKDNNEKD